ncbi:MAG: hypothetical protein QHH10_09705 [Peptococcaceae bacterium]|jgi:hypothetical protein|nr:hypothetical protein [Peptococcaceae bacterium]MDH7525574.1 hypothetical protein [Peptococcaceae bacterium]
MNEKQLAVVLEEMLGKLEKLEHCLEEIKGYMNSVDDTFYDHEKRLEFLEKKARPGW